MQVAAFLLLCGAAAVAAIADESREYSDDEISALFSGLDPKDSDFVFAAPTGWSKNLAMEAEVRLLDPSAGDPEAVRTVDGKPATTWTCRAAGGRGTIVLDLGTDVRFDRLIVFNRHTDHRGTGGGNNAVKLVGLSAARADTPDDFTALGDHVLEGPRPFCFKRKGGGQVCSFVDSVEPNRVELPAVTARYVKVEMREAFWGSLARDDWKTSVAVSEIMLFDSRAGLR